MNKASEVLPGMTHESAGSILRAAREAKGIPVELVAHHLRLRVQQVVELEQDDQAHLPHTSYVRLLTIYYAKYLNIPVSRIEPHLPEKWDFQGGGYQMVCGYTPSNSLPRFARKSARIQTSSLPAQVLPKIVTCCIFLFLLILGTYFYFSRHHSQEDKTAILLSPTSPILPDQPGLAKAPPLSFETIRAFDSALLEKVPHLAAVHPPPLKLTKGSNVQKKAELLQSALRMSSAPALSPLTPHTVITAPSHPNARNSGKRSR